MKFLTRHVLQSFTTEELVPNCEKSCQAGLTASSDQSVDSSVSRHEILVATLSSDEARKVAEHFCQGIIAGTRVYCRV